MPPDTHDSDDYALIRPAAAAELAGVDVRTLARWEAEGKLHARRTAGGQRRYRRADIVALIDAANA